MAASKEAAYGEMYAAGLDPFAAFKKRERDTSSTWVERRLVGALASRRFREVAALYLMLLHGICYFLLFWLRVAPLQVWAHLFSSLLTTRSFLHCANHTRTRSATS